MQHVCEHKSNFLMIYNLCTYFKNGTHSYFCFQIFKSVEFEMNGIWWCPFWPHTNQQEIINSSYHWVRKKFTSCKINWYGCTYLWTTIYLSAYYLSASSSEWACIRCARQFRIDIQLIFYPSSSTKNCVFTILTDVSGKTQESLCVYLCIYVCHTHSNRFTYIHACASTLWVSVLFKASWT